jgi:hypothetical protein
MKIDVLATFSSSVIFSLNIFAILILQDDAVASTSHAISKGKYVKKELNRYEIRDFVMCLDEMFIKTNQSLHFAFLGDSLVRNQFLNLVSVSKILLKLFEELKKKNKGGCNFLYV